MGLHILKFLPQNFQRSFFQKSVKLEINKRNKELLMQ